MSKNTTAPPNAYDARRGEVDQLLGVLATALNEHARAAKRDRNNPLHGDVLWGVRDQLIEAIGMLRNQDPAEVERDFYRR